VDRGRCPRWLWCAISKAGTPLKDEGFRSLAEEQASLRRVATLVARRSPAAEVFAAATREVAQLFDVQFAHLGRYELDDTVTFVAALGGSGALTVGTRLPLGGDNVCTVVAQTGLPARFDSYPDPSGPITAAALERGIRSSIGTPIVVEGRLWGVAVIGSNQERQLPPDVEARLASFTELLATAIANAESRAELAQVAEEQAALRRVATLVARGVPPQEVFAAVTEEVGGLLPVEFAIMGRYEPDEAVITVAAWNKTGNPWPPLGSRWPLEGKNLTTVLFETGRPARFDSYADASGPVGVNARAHDFRSTVGAPIVVEGRLWGAMTVGSTELERPLPPDAEGHLASFTELLATAIANAESRAELAHIDEEQAALGRVATLVAHGSAPEELFAAVTREVGLLLGADLAGMARYGSDDTVTVLAAWAAEGVEHPLNPGPWPLEGGDLASTVFRTGKSVRIESYQGVSGPIAAFVRDELGIGSSVASPIVVEGRLWGVLFLHAKQTDRPFTRGAESRLSGFTELVAAAIANAESRSGLARLAEEQAALGRVATLVARAVPPEEVFAAATEEVGRLVQVDYAGMGRYESRDSLIFVASWGRALDFVPVGSRWNVGGHDISTLVFRTGRPARIDSYVEASGPLSVAASGRGVRSSVGTPIFVEGHLWGVMGVASSGVQALPLDTETRLASFTELLATSIANAESRAQLHASRVRIVAAGDEMRRRIERDLHDGAQQQLVSLMLELKKAEAAPPCEECGLHPHLARTGRALADVLDGLQEISRGVHPAVLSKGGLGPALKALSRRSAVPVELTARTDRRLPEHVEVAAYYVASEALTNAAKHASASVVTIDLDVGDPMLHLEIRDDGVGGADPSQGSGLVGLSDRIEALGGRFELTSPTGNGTAIVITVPLEAKAFHEAQGHLTV
jgi:GAF domain-containing protein